ncbi:proline-rich protein 36 [Amia ocellicauda]|uniref:proline-rich protein 36 n=1 Tax=Amia ocellicauda TaxID=2972642 RepID=UPI00346450AD
MKPDGVATAAMQPTDVLEAGPVIEEAGPVDKTAPVGEQPPKAETPPPSEQPVVAQQPTATETVPSEAKEGNSKPATPKAKTKGPAAGPAKPKPGTTVGKTAAASRPGTAQSRTLNGVQKPLSNGVATKKANPTALEKKKPSAASTATKRPGSSAPASPAGTAAKAADRKPVGAPRPASAPAPGTNGVKTGVAAAQPSRKVPGVTNTARVRPNTAGPRPSSTVPSKNTAAVTKPERPAASKTRPATGTAAPPRSVPTAAASKPTASSSRPPSSRPSAAAAPGGRSAALQPNKSATAPAKKDVVSKPAPVPRKPAAATAPITKSNTTAPAKTAKPERTRPGGAVRLAADPAKRPTTATTAAGTKTGTTDKPARPKPCPPSAASPRAPPGRAALSKTTTPSPRKPVGSSAPMPVRRAPKPTQTVLPLGAGGQLAQKTELAKSDAGDAAAVAPGPEAEPAHVPEDLQLPSVTPTPADVTPEAEPARTPEAPQAPEMDTPQIDAITSSPALAGPPPPPLVPEGAVDTETPTAPGPLPTAPPPADLTPESRPPLAEEEPSSPTPPAVTPESPARAWEGLEKEEGVGETEAPARREAEVLRTSLPTPVEEEEEEGGAGGHRAEIEKAEEEINDDNEEEEEEEEEGREGSQPVSVSEMSETQPTEEEEGDEGFGHGAGAGGAAGGRAVELSESQGATLTSEVDESEDVSCSQPGLSELSAPQSDPGLLEGTESIDELGDASLKGAEGEGVSAGSPDIETVPEIPAHGEEDEEEEGDYVCDMDVGSERVEAPRRRREEEEEEDDEDVEMASEGVTESGLESYGNADEDDFAEDDRAVDNLNRCPPASPPLPPAQAWAHSNPFSQPWAPRDLEDDDTTLTDPPQGSAPAGTPPQSPAQAWLEHSSAVAAATPPRGLGADLPSPSHEPESSPMECVAGPPSFFPDLPSSATQGALRADAKDEMVPTALTAACLSPSPSAPAAPTVACLSPSAPGPLPEHGLSQSSTLSGAELAAHSSSETSTPEELRDYDSSSGVESRSEDKLEEPVPEPTRAQTAAPELEQDLGIHLEKGDDEEEEEGVEGEEEAETLPADEILGDPPTEPASAPSSSSSSAASEEEASDTEGEMQINDPEADGIDNLAFETKPGTGAAAGPGETPANRASPNSAAALSSVQEAEETSLPGEGDADGDADADSAASYVFDCTSVSNAQSTTDSCGKSPGIFSLENEEQLPEEAKDLSLIQELNLAVGEGKTLGVAVPDDLPLLPALQGVPPPGERGPELEYMLCGKPGAGSDPDFPGSAGRGGSSSSPPDSAEENSSSSPASGGEGDPVPSYYSTVCEKTDIGLAGNV